MFDLQFSESTKNRIGACVQTHRPIDCSGLVPFKLCRWIWWANGQYSWLGLNGSSSKLVLSSSRHTFTWSMFQPPLPLPSSPDTWWFNQLSRGSPCLLNIKSVDLQVPLHPFTIPLHTMVIFQSWPQHRTAMARRSHGAKADKLVQERYEKLVLGLRGLRALEAAHEKQDGPGRTGWN